MSKQFKHNTNIVNTRSSDTSVDKLQPNPTNNNLLKPSSSTLPTNSKKKSTWNTPNLPQRTSQSLATSFVQPSKSSIISPNFVNGTIPNNTNVLDPTEFPALGAKPIKSTHQNFIYTNNQTITSKKNDFPTLSASSTPQNKPTETTASTNGTIEEKDSIKNIDLLPLTTKETQKVEKQIPLTKVNSSINNNAEPKKDCYKGDSENYGILKISKLIKNKDLESNNIYRFGTELKNLGTNINSAEELCLSHLTPWSDINQYQYNVRKSIDRRLPECYALPPLQPASKMTDKFSDETLFYIFYKMPRTLLQDAAAQELFNRNWRFHKTIRKWVTKDSSLNQNYTASNQTSYEKSTYIFFEPEIWEKVEKAYTLTYDSLEDRSVYMNNIGAPILNNNVELDGKTTNTEATKPHRELRDELATHKEGYLHYDASNNNNVHSHVLHNK